MIGCQVNYYLCDLPSCTKYLLLKAAVEKTGSAWQSSVMLMIRRNIILVRGVMGGVGIYHLSRISIFYWYCLVFLLMILLLLGNL